MYVCMYVLLWVDSTCIEDLYIQYIHIDTLNKVEVLSKHFYTYIHTYIHTYIRTYILI